MIITNEFRPIPKLALGVQSVSDCNKLLYDIEKSVGLQPKPFLSITILTLQKVTGML